MHAHVHAISPLLQLPLYLRCGVTNVRDLRSCPQRGIAPGWSETDGCSIA
jgi:hypothetical protein